MSQERPEIPQSSALQEADTDSLSELMSRDPEGLLRQDRDRIVEALRAQRERIAAGEAAGAKKAPRGQALKDKATSNLDDMGL